MKEPQQAEALELNAENLRKGLLQYNYFPRAHDQKEEMPPIISSEALTPEVANKLLGVELCNPRKKAGYDVMPYRRTRHPNIPRIMGIPHPRAYVELVDSITKNWEDKLRNVCQSQNSELTFEVQADFRIIVHSYNTMPVDGEIENADPSLDFGMNYRVKTDITNFYPSIYSHSLPWALVGHKEAKKQRSPDLWFNEIDAHARRCQRNETKGLPIGPATSSILSEIILYPIDEVLREKGYSFSRYIDDYKAFTESKSEADSFLMDLSRELEKYSLGLNSSKTATVEMPVINKDRWVTEMNLVLSLNSIGTPDGDGSELNKLGAGQLRLIVEKAIVLSKEYPDGSVIKYAFSSIIDRGVEGEDAERYLQDTLLKYAYYYPALIPLIHKWAGLYSLQFDIDDRLHKLYLHSLAQGQTDNVVWCIYYLLRTTGFENYGLLAQVCEDEAPMSILMGYVYAKKNGLEKSPIAKWANEKITNLKKGEIEAYDIDRYWLVFYQLYFDDVISSAPYNDEADNKVFQILKEEKVSFVDYDHPDLKSPFADFLKKLKDKNNPSPS